LHQVGTSSLLIYMMHGHTYIKYTISHVVNLSLTLLKMGKRLPETCWADLGDQ